MKRFFRFLAMSGARIFRPLAAAATKSSWLGRVLFALVVGVWTTVAVMWVTGWRLIEPGFPHTGQLVVILVAGFFASLFILRIFRRKKEAGAKKLGAAAVTVPHGEAGDWLAKIYAIGDRVKWPRPSHKKTIKIKAGYILVGLALVFLISLGLQFRLDWNWAVWVSTGVIPIFLFCSGSKVRAKNTELIIVLSIMLFLTWILFFTLIVICGLNFQTQI